MSRDSVGIYVTTQVFSSSMTAKLSRENLAAILAANGRVPPSVAWDLPSLITALEDAMPSVILLDMATRDSAALLRATFQINPNARVIVLGVSGDDEAQIVACAEAGVCGFHLRTESLDDLLVLIGKVASGESLFSPGVSAILLRRLSALAARWQPAAKELVLTPREAADPSDAGDGPLEPEYRGPPGHRDSHRQEPRAQCVDQAWRPHSRGSRGTRPAQSDTPRGSG